MDQIQSSKIEELEIIVKIMNTMLKAIPLIRTNLKEEIECKKTFISCLGRLEDILKIKH